MLFSYALLAFQKYSDTSHQQKMKLQVHPLKEVVPRRKSGKAGMSLLKSREVKHNRVWLIVVEKPLRHRLIGLDLEHWLKALLLNSTYCELPVTGAKNLFGRWYTEAVHQFSLR